jgi:hypothetical protein
VVANTVRAPSGPPVYNHQPRISVDCSKSVSMLKVKMERMIDPIVIIIGTNQKLDRTLFNRNLIWAFI